MGRCEQAGWRAVTDMHDGMLVYGDPAETPPTGAFDGVEWVEKPMQVVFAAKPLCQLEIWCKANIRCALGRQVRDIKDSCLQQAVLQSTGDETAIRTRSGPLSAAEFNQMGSQWRMRWVPPEERGVLNETRYLVLQKLARSSHWACVEFNHDSSAAFLQEPTMSMTHLSAQMEVVTGLLNQASTCVEVFALLRVGEGGAAEDAPDTAAAYNAAGTGLDFDVLSEIVKRVTSVQIFGKKTLVEQSVQKKHATARGATKSPTGDRRNSHVGKEATPNHA